MLKSRPDTMRRVQTAVYSLLTLAMLTARSLSAADDSDPQRTPQTMLAHRFSVLAQFELEGPRNLNMPQQVAWARMLLDQATTLDPDNPELWRLKIEALDAEQNRDTKALADALIAYIRLQPLDDVAQLRLILLRVEQQQTVEDRLRILRRVIDDDRSASLSKPLRSRVAVHAAEMYFEQGRTAEYAEMIKRAIELDQTNKAAAAEAYRFLDEQEASRPARTEAALNLLAADPTDPATHRLIANLLIESGHYEPAMEWVQSMFRLLDPSTTPVETRIAMLYEAVVAMWGADKPDDALAQIIAGFGPLKEPAPAQPATTPAPDAPATTPTPAPTTAPAPSPAPTAGQPTTPPVPTDIQLLRLAIHQLRGDATKAAVAFADLRDRFDQHAKATPHDAMRLADLAWLHVLFNQQLEAVPPLIEQAAGKLPADEPVLARLRGWLAMREGRMDDARAALEPRAGDDGAAALGLALTYHAEQQKDQRVGALQHAFQIADNNLTRMLTARHLSVMGVRPNYDEQSLQVARLVAQSPRSLRQFADGQTRPALINIKPAKFSIEFTDPMMVEVELRNVASVPLAIGPNQAINSRLFLLPRIAAGAMEHPMRPQVVVDLHRRLRLDPGKALKLNMRIDRGGFSVLLNSAPTTMLSTRLTGILNPALYADGSIGLGARGSTISVRSIDRLGWPYSLERGQQLIAQVGAAPTHESMRAIAILAQTAPFLAESKDAKLAEEGKQLAAALVEKFATLDPPQQAWMLLYIAAGHERSDALYKPVVDAGSNSANPLVAMAALAVHANDPDSTVLNAGLRNAEGSVVRLFAEHTKAILARRADLKAKADAAQPTNPAAPPAATTPAPGPTPNPVPNPAPTPAPPTPTLAPPQP